MPSISVSFAPNGPIVQVMVGVSIPREDAMRKAGVAVPAPVLGTFLIDTGASNTCIDPKLMAPLPIMPSGAVAMQTPSTNGVPVMCNQYDVTIFIPSGGSGARGFLIPALPIIEASLSTQGISGLIGRDVLDRCVMVYNGSLKTLTLSY